MPQQPQPAASPAFLQALDTHLKLLRTHVDFLKALVSTTEESTLQDVLSMLQRATSALNDAQSCAQHYNAKQNDSASTSPLPVRTKRKSGITTVAADDGHEAEGSAKKRRRASRTSGANTAATAPQTQAPSTSASTPVSSAEAPPSFHPPPAEPNDTDPDIHLEYSDISAEVDARLQLLDQRRAERSRTASLLAQSQSQSQTASHSHPQQPNDRTKRKRKSSLGDSLLFTESELAYVPGMDGAAEVDGGAVEEGVRTKIQKVDDVVGEDGKQEQEKEKERKQRISEGGTRQIKKPRTRTTRVSGRASVLPLSAVSVPNTAVTASAGPRTEGRPNDKAGGQHEMGTAANGNRAGDDKAGTRIPLNQSDGDGKMKKRRRSSNVAKAQGVVEHKYANDDRSTKRRRR